MISNNEYTAAKAWKDNHDPVKKLEEENDKLIDALKYYANPENYKSFYEKNAPVMIEKGERARMALGVEK